MKLTEQAGFSFSNLGGSFLARQKAKKDADKNRKRLGEAAAVSRELGLQRIANDAIKKILARLAYEADAYIAAAQKSEDADYDPLALDALDTARAAISAWKKNENEAAAGKYLGINGISGGIVIPADAAGQNSAGNETLERTLGILYETLRLFVIQNSVRNAGDIDAALAALAEFTLIKTPGEAAE